MRAVDAVPRASASNAVVEFERLSDGLGARAARNIYRSVDRSIARSRPAYKIARQTIQQAIRRSLRLGRLGWKQSVRGIDRGRGTGSAREASRGAHAQDGLRALEQALSLGALDTASALAEQVLMTLPRSDVHHYRRGLFASLRTLLGIGAVDRAKRLAWDHQDVLRGTIFDARTIDIDDALAHLDTIPVGLASGGLNTFLLSQLIAGARLSTDALTSLLREHRWRYFRNPQLDLLLASAYLRDEVFSAKVPLNRFLHWHRLPQLTRLLEVEEVEEGDNILSRLVFMPPAVAPRPVQTTVSVIMSAFGARDTIGYAVASILAQSHRALELLVADDGGNDDTLSYLSQRFGADGRLRLFRSMKNQGTYNVRNQLIDRARGELITFQDADDVALPNRIALQCRYLQRQRAIACVGDWIRVKPEGNFVFFRDQSATRLSVVSLMFHRRALACMGRYHPAQFGADLEFLERLKYRFGPGQVARLRMPLIFGLWSGRSLTRRAGGEALENGYRAPARRVYGELIYRQHRNGWSHDIEAETLKRLKESQNLMEPSHLVAYP